MRNWPKYGSGLGILVPALITHYYTRLCSCHRIADARTSGYSVMFVTDRGSGGNPFLA
jgi:hypothetical protein